VSDYRSAFLLVALLICGSLSGYSQLNARAGITLKARLPSSVTVSVHTIPVEIRVSDGVQQVFSTTLAVKWNVDPQEIPAFRVVASFHDANAALLEPWTSTVIRAGDLECRWGPREYQRFGADASITLFSATVPPEVRQGEQHHGLQMKIADDRLPSLPDGSYEGVLIIEVRQY
jgi:hypothetical protein